jgi:SAM-dependent methyltransferase
MQPISVGSDEQLLALRHFLVASRYTGEAICERLGIATIADFQTLAEGREPAEGPADVLNMLIGFFLDGARAREELVRQILPADAVELLLDLHLLQAHPDDDGTIAASVLLYPVENLYIISDLIGKAPGAATPEELTRGDLVYAAITENTENFLEQIPRSSCDTFLELCGGTGAAALLMAASACEVWSSDITRRSTEFARFNARLNGIQNFHAVEGDLYEPVRGLTFDRIAAHPPYVPAARNEYIYAHGGRDGEDVLRGVLAGVHAHLRPGGRFYCTCVTSDRVGAPLEARIREMLGETADEFDLLLGIHYEQDPSEHCFKLASLELRSVAWAEEHHRLYKELGVEQRVYCSMVLERIQEERPPLTARIRLHETARGHDLDHHLDITQALASSRALELLAASRPTISAGSRLEVTHRPGEDGWVPDECTVATLFPFQSRVVLGIASAMFLARCQGAKTPGELLREMRVSGELNEDVADDMFLGFVRDMVLRGILTIPAPPIAPPAARDSGVEGIEQSPAGARIHL